MFEVVFKVVLGTTEIAYIDCLGTPGYYDGYNRDTLRFICEPDVIGVDALNAILLNKANTTSISCIRIENGQEVVTNVYDGYTEKYKCGLEKMLVTPETASSPAVYADKLVFVVGRKVWQETLSEALLQSKQGA